MRGKIILPNLAVVLLLGVGSYFFLRSDLQGRAKESLEKRMKILSALFVRSESLHGYELLSSVRREAMSKNMVQAFSPVDLAPGEGASQRDVDAKVRQAWFARVGMAIQKYSDSWQETHAERPALVLLTDRAGVVIARNITPNACPTGHNLAESVPLVKRALDGEGAYAVWSVEDSPFSSTKPDKNRCQLMNAGLMELAASPVWFGDDIAGVLVIGFEISNGSAKQNAAMLGMDLAVLKGGHVYSSSFDTDTARQSLEQQLDTRDVQRRSAEVIKDGVMSGVFELTVEGSPYSAMMLPSVHSDKADQVITLMLGSQDAVLADLKGLGVLPVFVGLAILVVFGVGMVLANHFMRPIMAIEEGILKVINGEFNYRFDVESSEVGGLSYRINQMIGVLQGEEEESDEA